MRLALAYDYLYAPGGAENVTLRLSSHGGISRVLVASRDAAFFPNLPAKLRVLDSRPPPNNPLLRGARSLAAFRSAANALRDTDLVIYSGHYSVAARAPPTARRVYYCHSLPLGSAAPPMLRAIGRLHDAWLLRHLLQMDRVIANSTYCADAWRRLGLTVEVLAPPVDLSQLRWQPGRGYYLSLARHEPPKRVDRVVRAFVLMPDLRLVVAGSGSRSQQLQRIAEGSPNIQFAGALARAEVEALVAGSIATIHAGAAEPLGVAILESLAAGKPVIVSNEGGQAALVRQGKSGVLLPANPSVDALVAAVRSLPPPRAAAMRVECEQSVIVPALDEFVRAVTRTA